MAEIFDTLDSPNSVITVGLKIWPLFGYLKNEKKIIRIILFIDRIIYSSYHQGMFLRKQTTVAQRLKKFVFFFPKFYVPQ